MAKSRETFNKKNKEQKKQKQRQEKQEKMEERKMNAKKGKSLQEMMAYVDENGNISDTPPDPRSKKIFKAEDIQIAIPPGNERDHTRLGTVQFFNEEKGFGFIIDDQSRERIFFHNSNLTEPVRLNDKVQYEMQPGDRGWMAVDVKRKS
ncbi:MAG TPA: cold shock domain-containing protein [Chitinophagaceae bacterium]|nr:cold shock domain-containing protein [Chitinophagaceae bacterium]